MNEKLSILITEYDIDNVFFVVKKDNKNLYVDMGICQFVEEMDVFCKPKLAKVAKYFWRMLHLQNGESCNGLISLV